MARRIRGVIFEVKGDRIRIEGKGPVSLIQIEAAVALGMLEFNKGDLALTAKNLNEKPSKIKALLRWARIFRTMQKNQLKPKSK